MICRNCTAPAVEGRKSCSSCLERYKRYKRKRQTKHVVIPNGFKKCTECLNPKPFACFGKKNFLSCVDCRTKRRHRNQKYSASCKQALVDWKKSHKCLHCGTHECIETDHIDPSTKVKGCSYYFWWTYNGGVKALKQELLKCQPLCRFCHRLKTKNERQATKSKNVIAKRKIIDKEKLKRGKCLHCERVVTPDTVCGFDFDHRLARHKAFSISQMVCLKTKVFHSKITKEMKKCDLLCANCHKKKTPVRYGGEYRD